MLETDMSSPELTELTDDFDPERLSPGFYAAVSTSNSYPTLLAMTVDGSAKLLGEENLAPGIKAIVASVSEIDNDRRRNASGMVRAGANFYKTALRDYSNWKQTWWREAIQNSVDSGADNIELGAVENADGTWSIWCQDNGSGMSEDILLNKFLVLGETTKGDSYGNTGGFGKAKELLILPWLKWMIHSRDLRIEGAGLGWESSAAPTLNGTRLEVLMPTDQYTYISYAEAFVALCTIPGVKFTLVTKDGRSEKRAQYRPGHVVSEVEGKAEIRYNKSVLGSAMIVVRVRGLAMYTKPIYGKAKGRVCVEIIGRSIDLLTANRDSIRDYRLDNAIDEFEAKITVDSSSALREKRRKEVRKVWRGTGRFVAEKRQAQVVASLGGAVDTSPLAKGKPIEVSKEAAEQVEEMYDDLQRKSETDGKGPMGSSLPSGSVAREVVETTKFRGQTHYEAVIKQLAWEPDWYADTDIEDYKLLKKFTPEGMTGNVLRLAKTWTEMCRYVFTQLGCDKPWGVGFIISENALAACLHDDGTAWLLLNPYADIKKRVEILSPTNDEQLRGIFASAIHEATHIVDGLNEHDEAFSSALTHNIARCATGWKHIKSISRKIGQSSSARADVDRFGGKISSSTTSSRYDFVDKLDGLSEYQLTDLHLARLIDNMLIDQRRYLSHGDIKSAQAARDLYADIAKGLSEHGESSGRWVLLRRDDYDGRISAASGDARYVLVYG